MKCFVTGSTGFIGRRLVEGLTAAGHAVLRDLSGAEALFHYAWTTTPASSHERWVDDIETNLIGSGRLFRDAVKAGVRHIVFPSSGGTVYGIAKQVPIPEDHPTDPISAHGVVKLSVEKHLQLLHHELGVGYTILRYSNAYGPGQRVKGAQGAVAAFAQKILAGEPISIWGDGLVVRDFIHVQDIVRATVQCLVKESALNQVINVGTGVGTSLRELIVAIERASGRKARVENLPPRVFDLPINVLDVAKARRLLDWSPAISLDEGLATVLQA